MTAYLLDTNLLLRISDGNSATHLLSIEAIEWLLAQEHQLYVTGQNLIEFWAVATRPLDVNGLGWTTQKTETMIILAAFSLSFQQSSKLQSQHLTCQTPHATLDELRSSRK